MQFFHKYVQLLFFFQIFCYYKLISTKINTLWINLLNLFLYKPNLFKINMRLINLYYSKEIFFYKVAKFYSNI
jgi:hypothetical protein